MKALAPAIALAAALAFALPPSAPQASPLGQAATTIGVDTQTADNTATSLGDVASCTAVNTGDTFPVDIFVTDVKDLLAWEIYFGYDPSIVHVVDRDVQMFQAASALSTVVDVSAAVPDSGGLFRAAAADTADPQSPDSGSGVLVRLTLEAVAKGVSPATIAIVDIDDDGSIDFGPLLRDVNADAIGDTSGDNLFDGSVLNAEVAVDSECANGDTPPAATATPADSKETDGGGSDLAIIVVAVVGGAVAVSAAGAALLLLRRRR